MAHGDAHGNGYVWPNDLTGHADELGGKGCASGHVPTEPVGAAVPGGGQELVGEVSGVSMDVDRVKPCLHGPLHRAAELRDDVFDLLGGQFAAALAGIREGGVVGR